MVIHLQNSYIYGLKQKKGETTSTSLEQNKLTGYNERKLQILKHVIDHGRVTASDIAGALNLEIHNARNLLRKYSRQGLLTRHKSDDPWGTRIYDITEKGLDRIDWIRESLRDFEEDN